LRLEKWPGVKVLAIFYFCKFGLALGFPDHELDIYNVNVTWFILARY